MNSNSPPPPASDAVPAPLNLPQLPSDGPVNRDAAPDAAEPPLDELEPDDELGGDDRAGHQPIAEFLYQLTKMLTDDNTEVIEWSDGRIKVHDPQRLEADILHKYFRHSKFASFQRQLNYFGFRKIAGKGKMSPCSYVNDSATTDIRSLLLIKRKTNGSAARKAALQQRGLNPLLGFNLQSLAAGPMGLGLGTQPFTGLGGPSLASAMALLSENALRAGLEQLQGGNNLPNQQLGLLALQQQQQLQQLQQQQLQQQLQQQNQQQQLQQNQQPSNNNSNNSASDQMFQGMSAQHKSLLQSSSLEQLAQLTAQLQGSQQNNNNNNMVPNSLNSPNFQTASSGLQAFPNNAAAMFMNGQNPTGNAPGLANPASAAMLGQQNPATAALNNPASAALQAMDAVSGGPTAVNSNNLFESALNLKSLLQEHQESAAAAAARNQATHNGNGQFSGRANQQGGPSSALFPDTMSSMSLGNLLGSSNRLNSLLSLNSLMGSREPSLADFAALNGMHQFPYAGQFPPPGAAAAAGGAGVTAAGGANGSAPLPFSAADLAQRLRQGNYS